MSMMLIFFLGAKREKSRLLAISHKPLSGSMYNWWHSYKISYNDLITFSYIHVGFPIFWYPLKLHHVDSYPQNTFICVHGVHCLLRVCRSALTDLSRHVGMRINDLKSTFNIILYLHGIFHHYIFPYFRIVDKEYLYRMKYHAKFWPVIYLQIGQQVSVQWKYCSKVTLDITVSRFFLLKIFLSIFNDKAG